MRAVELSHEGLELVSDGVKHGSCGGGNYNSSSAFGGYAGGCGGFMNYSVS